MTAADLAYVAAKQAIAKAKSDGRKGLDLSGDPFHALNRLPPEVASLRRMNKLYLSSSNVADLAPLAKMTWLTRLYIDNTLVSDLTPVSELVALTSLNLDNTPVSDLRPLSRLPNLTSLNCNRTMVRDLAPIAGIATLTWLSFDSTQVVDLRPLFKLLTPVRGSKTPTLSLNNIPAAKDPAVAPIAAMEEGTARALALYILLRDGWVPPEIRDAGNVLSESLTLDSQPTEPARPFFLLSYSTANRPRIAGLRDFLAEKGLPVWWDQDIAVGAEWRKTIADQLRAARAVVTFWTANSVESKAVIEEASTAQADGRLVHVRLDNSPLPYGFGETQYVDLRDWDGTATHPQMAKLLQALRDRLNPLDAAAMAVRLVAASPVAMVSKAGRLSPVDTPPNVRPTVENKPDLEARIEGLKQTLEPLRAKAADRVNYQFPTDLGHALSAVHGAVHAKALSWYGIDDARATLCDCMDDHDAKRSWNASMVWGLDRLVLRMAELRPLLQPRQVPPDAPGAKPPEPEPEVRQSDIAHVAQLADEVAAVVASPEAVVTLDQAAKDYLLAEVNRIKSNTHVSDENRKFANLRKAVRGLVYGTSAIIVGVSSGVAVNLLTAPGAATTLANQLKPILDKLLNFFL